MANAVRLLIAICLVLTASSCGLEISSTSLKAAETQTASDPNLIPSNIKSGVTISGIIGSFLGSFQSLMGSSAPRDAGVAVVANIEGQATSKQITTEMETALFKDGADLPTLGGYSYRDIPDSTKDDEGLVGSTCKYAARPSVDCGITQATIAGRIADCATKNPSTSTWDGAVQCNSAAGAWKLVSRNGANKEVWQDQRTQQLWSSIVGAVNWCRGSGNTQVAPVVFMNAYNTSVGTPMAGNGTIGAIAGGATSQGEWITITFTSATTFTVSGTAGVSGCQAGSATGTLTTAAGSTTTFSRSGYCSFRLTQGSTNFAANDIFYLRSYAGSSISCAPGASSGLQPASPLSYCAEASGLNAPPGENWSTGVYMAAKGGMGKTSTSTSPSVRWRMPTISDYKLADVNGVRMVLPDMGVAGASRPVPDGSVAGGLEFSATLFSYIRNYPWAINTDSGAIGLGTDSYNARNTRCVGR